MKNTIVILDNFDSFTYNLVDEFRGKGFVVKIFRNSIPAETVFAEIKKMQNPILVISPGPGTPSEAGCLMKLIELCHRKVPMLGICLGHQAICQFYGATIVEADEIVHGKCSQIDHRGVAPFEGIPTPAPFARYHSLIATKVPPALEVIASANRMVMAVRNRADRVLGFQFHPESIMSPHGAKLLENSIKFLSQEDGSVPAHAVLDKLYAGEKLSVEDTESFFAQVVRGNVEQPLLTAALVAMKLRGETSEEIAGAARALLADATPFPRPDYEFCDIVGTGGDGAGSINISTTAAIVAACGGVKVAKHGNRSVSSKSGASDMLSTLGVKLDISPDAARVCMDEVGMAFLFAPLYHKGFKYAVPVRQALKTRTIFNLLGPLVNPAHPTFALIGVYDAALTAQIAQTLKNLGYKRAFVVNGSGTDEIAIHGTTKVAELHDSGEISEYELSPADFGLQTFPPELIRGGNPAENCATTKAILSGKGAPAHVAVVAANAAPLFYMNGMVKNLRDGAALALEKINSGEAWKTAQRLIAFTQAAG